MSDVERAAIDAALRETQRQIAARAETLGIGERDPLSHSRNTR